MNEDGFKLWCDEVDAIIEEAAQIHGFTLLCGRESFRYSFDCGVSAYDEAYDQMDAFSE